MYYTGICYVTVTKLNLQTGLLVLPVKGCRSKKPEVQYVVTLAKVLRKDIEFKWYQLFPRCSNFAETLFKITLLWPTSIRTHSFWFNFLGLPESWNPISTVEALCRMRLYLLLLKRMSKITLEKTQKDVSIPISGSGRGWRQDIFW